MHRITTITRNEIYNVLFKDNNISNEFGIPTSHIIYFTGQLSMVEFLSKLYDLKSLPSEDSRFNNAEEDIHHHSDFHNDYDYDFIWTNDRFNLKDSDDSELLKFLCTVFHPEVRIENSPWLYALNQINTKLKIDGYELYPSKQISGLDVYDWRNYIDIDKFKPFSIRRKDEIKNKVITITIPLKLRKAIYKAIDDSNEMVQVTHDNGFNEQYWLADKLLSRISYHYEPKCFNTNGEFSSTSNLEQYILKTTPFYVFDAIEIYSLMVDTGNFATSINELFRSFKLPFQIYANHINDNTISDLTSNINLPSEKGVSELFHEAEQLYLTDQKKLAVEKIWDTFERIKTVLIPNNKKKSANKLANKMGKNNSELVSIFEEEFNKLTIIGNTLNIRHFELDTIDINNNDYCDYFYQRCAALINLAIKFLNS